MVSLHVSWAPCPTTRALTSGPDPELVKSWHLLVSLVLDQRWRWAEVAAQLGITQAGLRTLLAINPLQARPMRELAAAMNCDPSYITGMVDDLERAGYATDSPPRRPASQDHRPHHSRSRRPADRAR